MNNNAGEQRDVAQLNREGENLFQDGDIAGAMAKFELALTVDDAHPETLNNLGVGHLHLGDTERALQCLARGLESHPQNRELLTNACTVLRELGYDRDAEILELGVEALSRGDTDTCWAPGEQARDFVAGLAPLGARPLVSVVVIADSGLAAMQSALGTLAAQSYDNWEAVIISSHREAAALRDRRHAPDARIRYHETRADNPAGARNDALRAAQGEVICYLNDTELFLPHHLSTVVAALRERAVPFVYTDAQVVHGVAADGACEALFTDQVSSDAEFCRDRILVDNPISIATWAHRAGFVESLGGFDESLRACEDWDLLLRFSGHRPPVHVPRVSVQIRRQGGAVDLARTALPGHLADGVVDILYRRYPVTAPALQRARNARLRQLAHERRRQSADSPYVRMDELYPLWVEKHQLSEADGEILAERMMTDWSHQPTIEILMVAEPGDESRMCDTAVSLRRQLYGQWRLTVICPEPMTPCPGLPQARFRAIVHRGDPTAALNSVAKGTARDWIALIDPGDLLPPHALFACADYIRLHPNWRLLYTDEDCIDPAGNRFDPKFRPDINMDLLRSTAYTGPFCLVRADAWRALAGVTTVDDSKTYDLTLKVVDRFGEDGVGHIADVLYHRRRGKRTNDDGEIRRGELRALKNHFERNGIGADVEPGYLQGTHFITYRHDQSQPLVSIIVPTRDKLEYLRPCVTSVLDKTRYESYELIIVDNGSDDPQTLEFLDELEGAHRHVRVLRYPHPFNYAEITNWAAVQARGDYLLLLNNDTHVVHDNWLGRMVNQGMRSEVGVVGARLVFADMRLQHAGVVTGIHDIADHVFLKLPMDEPGHLGRAQCVQNYSAVTAACMLVRKSVFLEVGGMDQAELAVLYNDVDLCLKIGARGLKVVWTPYATLIHHGSRSIREYNDKSDLLQRKSEAHCMVRRWLPRLARDPAYNRNLTLKHCDARVETQVDVSWDPSFHDRPRVMAFPFHRWGSGEYRVRAPVRALHDAGRIQYALMPLNNTRRAPHLCELERVAPDVLLMHNTLHDEYLKLLPLYKQYNSAYRVLGQDDLISALPPKNPYRKTVYPDIEQRIQRALECCDRLLVSTEPLAQAFAGMIEDIVVLPNYLERARWGRLRSARRRGARPRIGWAGAQQHQGDLELLIEVVRATRDEADWVFMGMCPEQIRPWCAEYHDGVTIDRYPQVLASLDLDLAVAPLEVNAFNEAKSNLRLLEYGILGWPVVCTDIFPYRDAPVCRVANTPGAWIDALRERIHDLEAAAREGDALRRWVRERWMLDDHLDEWMAALLPGQGMACARDVRG